MDVHRAKDVISILMDSPLYLSLRLEERRTLLERFEKSYPHLFTVSGVSAEEESIGYESSWSGIFIGNWRSR